MPLDVSLIRLSRRDRGLLQIGRLQVQIEHAQARIDRASSEEEAAIPQSSMAMYQKLIQHEIMTLP